MKKNAVILLSGGLDSTTVLAVAADQGYACHALSFSYGQRHSSELAAAKKIAAAFRACAHQIIPIPLSAFGHSALTDHSIAVPDYQERNDIPITYVPARNTIFLSFALAYAEVINASDIFIGVSHIDYSNYPDCRPEFINAFENLANLATRAGVEQHAFHIHAPLIDLSKAETIKLGLKLGVDYSLTISCYSANEKGEACGRCDSCELRKRGFLEAGIGDPTRYW